MSESYTKLSSTLVHSTVWRESAETRVVWITLLALADQHGEVHASVPGLADAARVTMEECETALSVFLAPDPYSRSKTLDGRRIVEIPGGWSIVNYDLYRGLLNLDHRRALARDRQARHRAKKRNDVTRDITQGHGKSRQAEAEADTSTTKATTPASAGYAFMGEMKPVWETACGGSIPPGTAKRLKPLVDIHGSAEVAARLAHYLAATDIQYASIPRFVSTYGKWDEKSKSNGQHPAERGFVMP